MKKPEKIECENYNVTNVETSDLGCAIFLLGMVCLFFAHHWFYSWLDRAYPKSTEPVKKYEERKYSE